MKDGASIAILGAGALGSVIGAFLARAGREVELWDINRDHLDAIRENGLIFDGPDGREIVRLPALHPEEASDTPDLIILLTKINHTDQALLGVRSHIDAGAHVLTLQNGLGNTDRVCAHAPRDRVLYGCTMMPGRFVAPGHVATPGQGGADFRALTKAGHSFAPRVAMEVPGFSLKLSPETDQTIWQKAAFNCAMNACSALTRARVGQLSSAEGMTDLLYAASAEVVETAKAQGVDADHTKVVAQIDHALANHIEHKASMLQDVEAERPTEIEALCGEVERMATAAGLKTPINSTLAALMRLSSALSRQEASP